MPRAKTMKLVSVHMPEGMLEDIEKARKKLGLFDRSDFIRYAVRALIMEVLKDESDRS